MRDWLAANAFFAGLSALAAGLLFLGWLFFVKVLHLDPSAERLAVGCWSMVALFLTCIAGKYFLAAVMRRSR